MTNVNNGTEHKQKCIIRLDTRTGQYLYLRSLFPIRWTEFISESEYFDNIEEARFKLNARYHSLSKDLVDRELSARDISILQFVDNKPNLCINYIN